MGLCKWIAGILYPPFLSSERSYERMKSEASNAYHWLGGYRDAADALRWLLDMDRNWNRAIGEPAIGRLPSDISAFRDILERRTISKSAITGAVYGPYDVTFIGPAVWAGITSELPPELVDKKVWLTTAEPKT